ncbi:MAG TPA: undecaprenyl-diphosphate phosphatase, partial [Allocoleopsis sp.]
IQAIILGIIQGITEFLPISSTAHLEVFTKLFHWDSLGSKAFLATIQFGSVIAVLMYFWLDINKILFGGFRAFKKKQWHSQYWRLIVGIAIGTLPILIFGFLLKKTLNKEDSAINSMTVIAITSIVMSLLLGLAEKFGSRERNFKQLQIMDGILMGLGQAIALVPGASRSGTTLTAGLFLGLERKSAAKFSFLLGIPALTIATLYEFFKEVLGTDINLFLVLAGVISAFIFSYISIAWLLKYLQTKNIWVFVWYRLGFGLFILLGIFTNVLRNS